MKRFTYTLVTPKALLLCLICFFQYTISYSQYNIYSDCGRLIAADNCRDVEHGTLNEIDGLESNTSFFTPDMAAQALHFCGFNTGVHNNIWIGFIPTTSIVTFEFEVMNCFPDPTSGGIQAAIVEAECAPIDDPNGLRF